MSDLYAGSHGIYAVSLNTGRVYEMTERPDRQEPIAIVSLSDIETDEDDLFSLDSPLFATRVKLNGKWRGIWN